MRLYPWLVGSLLLVPLAARAADDTSHGDRLRDTYFRLQTRQIADNALADIHTLDDWKKQRGELRRQFLEMVGLWPMPERTPLEPTITGTLESEDFTVEKLHFQSSPGLYVSANLYVPKKAKFPAPAVLYVCGHAGTRIGDVAYGNKVNYQHHPAWFARNGYVCLIVDTLQLGEIAGLHHGTYNHNLWWWHTLGYTPAGIECWNAIRALDYLESRKEVDRKRIGVTGRSGGGATSWWLAAADERPQCIIPVAGIADLWAHVVAGDTPRYRNGIISGHCDCMYFVNTYRWDFSQVVALCAPRPLMLGNSDADAIFPVPSYQRLARKARKIYDLYGASDRFVLLETSGPHKDTPEIRHGAFAWMNRWLKNDTSKITEPEYERFTPQQLQVFQRHPPDAINAIVPEKFIQPARPELPEDRAAVSPWWKETAPKWKKALREKVFHGWPEKPAPLVPRLAHEVRHAGMRLRAYDFVSEEGVPLRLWVRTHEKTTAPKLTVLTVVDEAGWQAFVSEMGPAFKEALYSGGNPAPEPYPEQDREAFEKTVRVLQANPWAFATLAPRGVGPTRWSTTSPATGRPNEQHILRRFVLLGQTLDGQRVWDVVRGLACLEQTEGKDSALWLEGKGEMAGIALYAGLFDPRVQRFDLWNPPASHRQGPTLLNVRKILDMPQALALAFPRKVMLYLPEEKASKDWDWPLKLQQALGQEYVKVRVVPK
jgi:hypothetical protein